MYRSVAAADGVSREQRCSNVYELLNASRPADHINHRTWINTGWSKKNANAILSNSDVKL